jgi:hypothetical protein
MAEEAWPLKITNNYTINMTVNSGTEHKVKGNNIKMIGVKVTQPKCLNPLSLEGNEIRTMAKPPHSESQEIIVKSLRIETFRELLPTKEIILFYFEPNLIIKYD